MTSRVPAIPACVLYKIIHIFGVFYKTHIFITVLFGKNVVKWNKRG